MSVRKREWTTPKGAPREAWIVEYTDQGGTRRIKTFPTKRAADAYHATVNVAVRAGIHTPDSQSLTIAAAAERWLAHCEANGHERATVAAYAQHVRLHIVPFLGATRLSALTLPQVLDFLDTLRDHKRSAAMRRKVRISLGALLAYAQERGLVAQNVIHSLSREQRRRGRTEAKAKLQIGVDIPTHVEIRAIIAALPLLTDALRWRPLLLTAIFTGLRASELRGLRWQDIDFSRSELTVRQRADRYGVIGRTKSEAGERTVPLIPTVVNVLRAHRGDRIPAPGELVFTNTQGNIEHRNTIVEKALQPAQVAANVVASDGTAKYPGLHSLRHFFASWCINRKIDGGLELPPKTVQAWLGHASITETLDTYGHLFPNNDGADAMAAAERAFLGS